MRPRSAFALVALALALAAVSVPGAAAGAAMPAWRPAPGASWQVQFNGQIDLSLRVEVYDLDAFDTSARMVGRIHALGRRAICYLNAGAWEDWRPDAGRYPASVKGRPLDGWPGERWLDIRRLDVLGPIIRERLRMCRTKGFDGVEFDNVNGYANRTGFALTATDQLAFNRWLAATARGVGLAVGLKNTLELAAELEPHFDFAILEQCFEYRECALAGPFLDANKAVLDIEYGLPREGFCERARRLGISAMRKRLALDAWRRAC